MHCLGIKGWKKLPLARKRLVQLVAELSPEVIQGWLYLGDVAAAYVGTKTKTERIVGSVRNSKLPKGLGIAGWGSRIKARRANTSVMTRTIACDQFAAQQHIDYGYDPDRMFVIPNMIPSCAID